MQYFIILDRNQANCHITVNLNIYIMAISGRLMIGQQTLAGNGLESLFVHTAYGIYNLN